MLIKRFYCSSVDIIIWLAARRPPTTSKLPNTVLDLSHHPPCQPLSWMLSIRDGVSSCRINITTLESAIRQSHIWCGRKLTSDGTIRALLSQDRRHSKRFNVSVFIDPRWFVTESLALEKSRSVSVDIGAIDRISMAIKDKVGNRRRCADSNHHFNGSDTITTGSRQYTSYSSSSMLKIVAFCSFIHILYPFIRLVVGSCAEPGRRTGQVVGLYVSLHSSPTRALAVSIHLFLSSQVISIYTHLREGFRSKRGYFLDFGAKGSKTSLQ